jgi:hypothetical protein
MGTTGCAHMVMCNGSSWTFQRIPWTLVHSASGFSICLSAQLCPKKWKSSFNQCSYVMKYYPRRSCIIERFGESLHCGVKGHGNLASREQTSVLDRCWIRWTYQKSKEIVWISLAPTWDPTGDCVNFVDQMVPQQRFLGNESLSLWAFRAPPMTRDH